MKNRKTAIVPLSLDIINIIAGYIRTWDTGSDYLFCDISGNQLTTGALSQAFRKYCRNRGVEHLGSHALRHSFARGWIRAGGGAFQLQQMLTHSDLTMTRRYVRLFADDLQDDVRDYSVLGNLRKGKTRVKTVKRL